jgi:class 3 adenylate cyclase
MRLRESDRQEVLRRGAQPVQQVEGGLQSKSAREACSEPGRRGERKQVTVLFADVKGSMELAEQLDAEEFGTIMQRFFHRES